MRSVKFLQRMVPYAPGDIAGFEDHIADRMIEIGVAEPYKTDAAAPEEAAPSENNKQPDVPPVVEIPANWSTLSNGKIKKLAESLGTTVASRDEAVPVIEAEIVKRAQASA